MALSYVTALRNAQLDEITAEVDAGAAAGQIRIYDDSAARPADANTAVPGGSVLLATVEFDDPSFAAASNGVLTANTPLVDDESADATGDALWFRVTDSDGNAVMDGDIGTSGSDLNLNSVSITAGGTVSITSFVVTAGNA